MAHSLKELAEGKRGSIASRLSQKMIDESIDLANITAKQVADVGLHVGIDVATGKDEAAYIVARRFEQLCEHEWSESPGYGMSCAKCRDKIPWSVLHALGWVPRASAYDVSRNALADKLQAADDELTQVLAENARLRREVERLGRRW